MQKVLRRTALAKRQAARRANIRSSKIESDRRKLRNNEQAAINRTIRDDIFAARRARREDWLLGPLAPKRDVGDAKDTYGTVSPRRLRGVEKAKGEYKDWCIEAGDRVVVVEAGHRDRGKIGKVREVKVKAEECTVGGLNQVDLAVPGYMLVGEQDKRPVRSFEAPIPLSFLRLVHPLPHPDTGALRDVVIKELQRTGRGRYIAGLEPPTEIPFPEKEPEVHEDYDIDTLRIEVEERTWVPTLLRPPMPLGVIDELRNKYSKFRDRHDAAFVARKMKEDEAAEEKKKSSKGMMTPLKELHRKERAERKARGKPVLSEDKLERIGEVMARNRAPGLIEQAVST